MKIRTIALLLVLLALSGCIFKHQYSLSQAEYPATIRKYSKAAVRLERCAANRKHADQSACANRIKELTALGGTIVNGYQMEHDRAQSLANQKRAQENAGARIQRLRGSSNPWDQYILFSELSAGVISPLDPDEASRVAKSAFEGFGECAKLTEPSCMSMYGELIIRGSDSLDAKSKIEARRKAFYWLNLAARYGHEPARKALVAEGETIPTPDLAMELLQREANSIAKDTVNSQEQAARAQAARDYEMIRETRRQNEQRYWANLFPKIVNCSSNRVGTYVYTRCQ